MAEYDIVLQLQAPAAVASDELERHMFDVLRVVEDHGQDLALGPVVAVDFSKQLIDIGFNVEAETLEQSQGRVHDVLKIIEKHSEVQFTPTAASASASSGAISGTLCVL